MAFGDFVVTELRSEGNGTYGYRAIALRLVVGLTIASTRTQHNCLGVRWSGGLKAPVGSSRDRLPNGRRSALIAGLGEVCGGGCLSGLGLLDPGAAAPFVERE